MDENEWLADRFEEHRAHLRAVAYRMLGSLTEADDAVQDTWLRLSRAGAGEVENLGGWLTTIVARVCLNMLRSRNRPARGVLRGARARPRRQPGPGAPAGGGGVAGRLGRPRPPRRARHPGPGRAAGVRAPRHVRAAVRGDRPDGRSDSRGGQAARQPGATPGEGRRAYRLRTRISPASGRWSTPSSRRRAGAISTPSSRCSIPTSCCGSTRAPGAPAASMVIRGAAAVARQAPAGSRPSCGSRSCARRW